MGADAFIAFYGLRYTLTDAQMDAVERKTDDRIVAARHVKLQTYFGRLTDGQPNFLLIGTRLGVFGIENESERSIDASQIQQIIYDTTTKLTEAGLKGEPQLHLQLEAQY